MKTWIAAVPVVAAAAAYMSVSSYLTPPKDYLPASYDFANWSPAAKGDVRSPCPVLNALANHDILPHSGKGLTIPLLQKALPGALNLEYSLATVLAVGGLFSSPSFWNGTFNLDDLDKHNFIEHDGSMSRVDFGLTGDAHTFNQAAFDEYMSAYGASETTSMEAAAKGRKARMETEQARDPAFTYGIKQHIISYGESSLVLAALGGGENLAVPTKFMRILWQEERFPHNEGWVKTSKPIGFGTVHESNSKIIALSGGMGAEASLIAHNLVHRLSMTTKSYL